MAHTGGMGRRSERLEELTGRQGWGKRTPQQKLKTQKGEGGTR